MFDLVFVAVYVGGGCVLGGLAGLLVAYVREKPVVKGLWVGALVGAACGVLGIWGVGWVSGYW